mgnify:FL=1
MPLSEATLRDLQLMADDRTPVGDGQKALALAVLEILDRLALTDTSLGPRTGTQARLGTE